MGGQACVFYGAAEFSRDCDIVLQVDSSNLDNLKHALAALEAECIALPAFEPDYLVRGHAIHFRCRHPHAANLRLDVMARLRGCDEFDVLWSRRTTIEDPESELRFELLSLEDLVRAKKTQRDKDWPMIRRLVEAHYDQWRSEPTPQRAEFWLRESRTPSMLAMLSAGYPQALQSVGPLRPWLLATDMRDEAQIAAALGQEELQERARDEAYWRPLKEELAELRMRRLRDRRADAESP